MRGNFKFLLLLLVVLVTIFVAHVFVFYLKEIPLFSHQIIKSYGVNFLLAAIILFLVDRNMRDGSAKGGFIFLIGSLLKFIVFFLLFYPGYNDDGDMETIEFTTFFIPYACCLILEVYHLGKQLNNQTS